MSLKDKSLTELRNIAQVIGIPDIFEKSSGQLLQLIEAAELGKTVDPIEMPPAFVGLTNERRLAPLLDPSTVVDMLAPWIKIGLKVRLEGDRWYLANGERTDEGSMRMPLRHVWQCAEKLMSYGRKYR